MEDACMGFELLSLKILYIAMDKSATISKAAGAEGLAFTFSWSCVIFLWQKSPHHEILWQKSPCHVSCHQLMVEIIIVI